MRIQPSLIERDVIEQDVIEQDDGFITQEKSIISRDVNPGL